MGIKNVKEHPQRERFVLANVSMRIRMPKARTTVKPSRYMTRGWLFNREEIQAESFNDPFTSRANNEAISKPLPLGTGRN